MWKPVPPPQRTYKKQVFKNAGKVCDFIYQIGETPLLREPSKEVDIQKIATNDQQAKFRYAKDCLLKYRTLTGYGRGISAVQVGIHERFSIVYTPENLITIVNPHILRTSTTLLMYPEMCMSANPIIAPTIRPSWIEFEYFDEKGTKHLWDTKDATDSMKVANRVFQHEIDHMDGVINIDRVTNPRDIILESDPAFYTNATFQQTSQPD